jgi:hypothetical protein
MPTAAVTSPLTWLCARNALFSLSNFSTESAQSRFLKPDKATRQLQGLTTPKGDYRSIEYIPYGNFDFT